MFALHTPGIGNNPFPEDPESEVEIVDLVTPAEGHHNDHAQPVTPIHPSGSSGSWAPRPPKGSLGKQGLAKPRGPPPRWARQQPGAGGQGEEGCTSKAMPPGPKAKWYPKQTTAPRPSNPLGNPWGRALGKGRRPGHWNADGTWEGRNKGQKRRQWASKPIHIEHPSTAQPLLREVIAHCLS